jgi:peptidyl-prolyl cis-trans isomerase B (cyclophilin B)
MRFFLIPLFWLILFSTPSIAENLHMSNPKVKLQTSLGDIIIELNPEKAPITSQNFLDYVESGFYEGTIFHRIIPGFMAQGGGFDTEFVQKDTQPPIKNEADNGLKNLRGSVAMARTSIPDSATSQFFINCADNGFLDHSSPTPPGWGYAVFGSVIDGLAVVEQMEKVATGSRSGHQDVPETHIVIEKASILKNDN